MQTAAAPATGSGPIVQLEAIRKSFGDNTVLRDINFRVEPGQVVALIGPSGSGKSTLLRCVNGLEDYQGGAVRVTFDALRGRTYRLERATRLVSPDWSGVVTGAVTVTPVNDTVPVNDGFARVAYTDRSGRDAKSV